MELPKPSTLAWGGLIGYVVAYDIFCPKGETLSEGVDRALERPKSKMLALGAIALTAAHLANLIPEQYDPFSRLLSFKEVIDDAMDVWPDDV